MRKNSPQTEDKIVIWRVPFGNTRLSHAQFLQIVLGFCHDLTIAETAIHSGVSAKSVGVAYRRLQAVVLAAGELKREVRDRQLLRDYHHQRKLLHRGWRRADEELHLAESERRLAVLSAGPFWLMFVVLEAAYRTG